jgi:hypothetical protein
MDDVMAEIEGNEYASALFSWIKNMACPSD